jgi:hypothetical protein
MPEIIFKKIINLIFGALLFTLVFGLFSVEVKDPDFWWHLKTGEYIYQNGSLPSTDPFAYTSTPKDPVNPESKRIKFILSQYWLAQVFFYWIYHLFSFHGIIFLRAFILTLLVFLVYISTKREGIGNYFSIVLLIPAVLILHTFTGERPQLFSFLFTFLLIYLLEGFRSFSIKEPLISTSLRSFGYLLPIPFIMLLWANLHGGFILGIIIALGYILSEWIKYFTKKFGQPVPSGSLKLLTAVTAVSILLTVINPNTYNVIPFLIEFGKGPYKSMITESMSPLTLFSQGFYEPQLITYFILLAINALLFFINRNRLDLTDVIIATFLALISLTAARFIPFYTPVGILMIARYSSEMLNNLFRFELYRTFMKKSEVPLAIILSIVLIIVINNNDLFQKGIRRNTYPEGAARFLKEHRISGNMFNPYVWGGYLLWDLYPDYKVFIDGRALIEEVFFQEVKVLDAYPKNMEGLPEWKALLNAYKVNFIITFSVGNFSGRLVPLIPALLNDPEWHLIYMDNISLIFLRGSPENRETIEKFGLPKEWLWNEVAVEAGLKAHAYPYNANYYITMGDAFFAKRSFSEAKDAYLKAQRTDRGNNTVQQRLDLMRSYGF